MANFAMVRSAITGQPISEILPDEEIDLDLATADDILETLRKAKAEDNERNGNAG